MRFLEGIGETRKTELLKQLRAVWTHDSTAIGSYSIVRPLGAGGMGAVYEVEHAELGMWSGSEC